MSKWKNDRSILNNQFVQIINAVKEINDYQKVQFPKIDDEMVEIESNVTELVSDVTEMETEILGLKNKMTEIAHKLDTIESLLRMLVVNSLLDELEEGK